MKRKLAAIMAADIVGYSRMMSENEAAALGEIKRFRKEVLGPFVAGNGGDVFKSMGDGWLVSFASSVDAVGAAMAIQDKADGPALRIGIHIGDVIEEDGDVFGDGVNIAARLEKLASPGGIAISQATYDSLDGTLSPSFSDQGPRELKNIARPVRVWERSAPGSVAGADPSPAGDTRADLPALAIHPVSAIGASEDLPGLCDSLTSDFASYIGAEDWLGASISGDAGAGAYALSSRLRGQGMRLRLETRLFAPDNSEIWAGKYDGDLDRSFDWQDEVSEQVSGSVLITILDRETRQLRAQPESGYTPEQHLLMAKMAWRNVSVDSIRAALSHLSRAIEGRPGFADAYCEAFFHISSAQSQGLSDLLGEYADRMATWRREAARLVSSHPVLDISLAIMEFQDDRQIAPLNQKIRDGLRRAPFDVRMLLYAGWGNIYSGQPHRALECFQKALRLNRFGPTLVGNYGGLATAHIQLGQDADAMAAARKGLELSDEFAALHSVMAAALAFAGEKAAAAKHVEKALAAIPGDTLTVWKSVNDYAGSAGGQRYFEGLRLAGYPE